MKRFYRAVTVVPAEGHFRIELDGRPVRTPARQALALPGEALAQGIAAEWSAQGDRIDPGSMPMTGLANAAIDRIAPDPASFAAGIAAYGESDLTCYRADDPAELVARQQAAWRPLIEWAAQRYGAELQPTSGIVHMPQPESALRALRDAVATHDPFTLAALSTLVSLSGSLLIGLAAIERAFPVAELWQASELDELWQADRWGDDDEALARRARRHDEFVTAARFAGLARDGRQPAA